ncbi:MAG TPA: hypothetical protein VGN55_03860 [Xanthobacteraceae bacterium]
MSTSELKAMLTAEKLDALAAMRASKLSAERAHAMDYYNGDMSRDMPAQEGRSRAVSTDVADTIDGLMPSLMEIFAGSDDVVRFEAFGPEDVAAAEQETDYVNHVFMQQNPGFLILYSFIKDALLSKVGIVKVWWRSARRRAARLISISPTTRSPCWWPIRISRSWRTASAPTPRSGRRSRRSCRRAGSWRSRLRAPATLRRRRPRPARPRLASPPGPTMTKRPFRCCTT